MAIDDVPMTESKSDVHFVGCPELDEWARACAEQQIRRHQQQVYYEHSAAQPPSQPRSAFGLAAAPNNVPAKAIPQQRCAKRSSQGDRHELLPDDHKRLRPLMSSMQGPVWGPFDEDGARFS